MVALNVHIAQEPSQPHPKSSCSHVGITVDISSPWSPAPPTPTQARQGGYALSLELPRGFLALFHGSHACFVLSFSNVLSLPFHPLPHSPISYTSSSLLPPFSGPLSPPNISFPSPPPYVSPVLAPNTPKSLTSSCHPLCHLPPSSLHPFFPGPLLHTLFILLSHKPPS